MKKTAMTLCFFLVSILLVSFAWGYDLPTAWKFKFTNVDVVFLQSITWDPDGGPVQIFTDLGDGIEDNWGIFKLTSIQDREDGDKVVWSEGDGGEYLTGIFWGLEAYEITAMDTDLDGSPDQFSAKMAAASTTSEGFAVPDLDGDGDPDAGLTFWLTTSGPHYIVAGGPGARTSASTYPSVTDGIKQGDFIYGPGILSTDASALTHILSDTMTKPYSGDGSGYLDSVPGSGPLADIVNTDRLETPWGSRDIFLEFDLRHHPDEGLDDYGWDVNSEDPVIGWKGEPEEPVSCRVTAGGNKDGVTVPCVLKLNGLPDLKTCADDITHNWGGQAGAAANKVDGNWTHHYKSKSDSFVFHSNVIRCIICSDPGDFCFPARDAPYRQIDFTGIGQFNNEKGLGFPVGVPLCFEVHLEDIGEPGPGGKWTSSDSPCLHCPGTTIVNADPQNDCKNCTDYYAIRIYDSSDYDGCGCIGDVLWVNGDILLPENCSGPHEGFFTRAGNVQMHPDNK